MPRKRRKDAKDIYTMCTVSENGCWEWTGSLCRGGYGSLGGKKAHRLSYERSKGQIPAGLFVCHACDNRKCINPDHLWLGTQRENMQDCANKGRLRWTDAFAKATPIGEGHGCSRLTEEQAKEVLRSTERGVSLARRFGVAETTISMIRRGRTWKHLSAEVQ